MKKIYHARPWTYRRWRAIRKEMLQLVLVIAGLLMLSGAVNAAAAWFISTLK